jgi:FKBP-type peptidyl-prolyl cis-trans isomerase SlpA
MPANNRVRPASRVRLHFSITLEDGTVAEDSFGNEPVEVVIGSGDLQAGLERPLLGLRKGDRQAFRIPPEQGFGFSDPEAVQDMRRSDFPKDMDLGPGLIIAFTTPAGDELPGTILELCGNEVRVDFNHPLAGHELLYKVEILKVINE